MLPGGLDVTDVISAYRAASLSVDLMTARLFPHAVVFELRLSNLDKSP